LIFLVITGQISSIVSTIWANLDQIVPPPGCLHPWDWVLIVLSIEWTSDF